MEMKMEKERLMADQDVFLGKLSWGERLGWAGGMFSQNLMIQFMASFIMIYLLDVALIPAATIAVIMIVTKVIDGLNDVASGYLLDNLRLKLPIKSLKHSKFRPWLLIMTPLCGLVVVLIYSIPSGASEVVKIAWYIIANLLFGFIFDFVNGAHGGVLVRMTQNNKERNLLSMIGGIGIMIAIMIVTWAIPFATGRLGDARGYQVVAIIISVLLVVGMYITVFTTKERVSGDRYENDYQDKEGISREKKYSVAGMFKLWAKNRALVVLFLVSIFSWLAQGFLSGMNPIYMKYYYGNMNHLWILTILGSMLTFPSLMISPVFANKFGKKNIYAIGMLISGVFSILRGFVPAGNMTFLIISALPLGIGTGFFLGMASSVSSDAVEYGQWKTGVRSEGLNASINNFYKKIVTAVASSVPALVLGWSGYVANAEVQTPEAINGILLSSSFLPGILFIISGLLFAVFFPINKRTLDRMINELQ